MTTDLNGTIYSQASDLDLILVGRMQITEFMYQGANGEFIEFTNVGTAPVDMTGWSFDDDSRTAGSFDLSAFGIVQPGESVILTEVTATAFRAAWGLDASVKVIGGLAGGNNLGRNDEINLYDASGNLVDRLSYGDQNFPGTPRTQGFSAWTTADNLAPTTVETGWVASTLNNSQNARSSTGGDLASPGIFNTASITDNDAPPAATVSIAAADPNAAESGTVVNPGTFTLTREGDLTADLVVTYTVGGTATNGIDYNRLSGRIVIPAGETSATITITPVNDANPNEGAETVILTLASSADYGLGASTSATVSIEDNTTGSLRQVGTITSANGAEISAFDPSSRRLYVVAGDRIEIFSLSHTGALSQVGELPLGFTAPAGVNVLPNSVAIKNGIVAVAYAIVDSATGAQRRGQVSFYNAATGAFLNAVEVGFLPDMVVFSPDGTRVLTADEGEPNSYGRADSFDPEGSVSIIDLRNGVANATVRTADFRAFNDQADALRAAGVRIFGPGATVAQDLEPEYITFSGDGRLAYVTLQENNALAVVDIATATVTQIIPLGYKDHSLPGNGLDASDRDGGVNIQNWPVFGMFQPDAIASYTVNGQTYFITANEGDARDYTGFAEEVRVGANGYVLNSTVFPNAAELKRPENLGRLTVTNATGDLNGDGTFDRIEVFGTRSFSIWDSNGNLVFDSGDELERLTLTQVPSIFNSNGSFTDNTFDTRSDNKGPEPEGVVVGVVNGRTYAFIGLERTGDVVVYDVTNPVSPTFIEYINVPGDVGIEGLTFVSATTSPTGVPLLITTNEVSNTISVFEFTPPPPPFNVISGTNRRDVLLGTDGWDRILASPGPDVITTGSGRDQIVYTHLNQSGDTITDFQVGADQLVFTDLLDSIGYGGTNPLADGLIRIRNLGNSGRAQLSIELDRSGGGRNQFTNFITFQGVDAVALNNPDNFVF